MTVHDVYAMFKTTVHGVYFTDTGNGGKSDHHGAEYANKRRRSKNPLFFVLLNDLLCANTL